jgi:hypothetical protein
MRPRFGRGRYATIIAPIPINPPGIIASIEPIRLPMKDDRRDCRIITMDMQARSDHQRGQLSGIKYS